eukprot:7020834-Pyramimonas_sp.AAC.1
MLQQFNDGSTVAFKSLTRLLVLHTLLIHGAKKSPKKWTLVRAGETLYASLLASARALGRGGAAGTRVALVELRAICYSGCRAVVRGPSFLWVGLTAGSRALAVLLYRFAEILARYLRWPGRVLRSVRRGRKSAHTRARWETGGTADGSRRIIEEASEGQPDRHKQRREAEADVALTAARESESGPVECVVCLDAQKNCVLIPCFHLCVCMACGKRLRVDLGKCPICRKEIRQAHRVYN